MSLAGSSLTELTHLKNKIKHEKDEKVIITQFNRVS